ncbi:MAG: hypothetical protein ACK518_03825 [bacterium]
MGTQGGSETGRFVHCPCATGIEPAGSIQSNPDKAGHASSRLPTRTDTTVGRARCDEQPRPQDSTS